MGVAIAMLLKSREPGRYQMSHQQFETIWKLRAGFSNVFMASKEGVLSLRPVSGDRAKHHLSQSPTQSLWFERFSQGCIHRMGKDVQQDWDIPLPVMHELMKVLEVEWQGAENEDGQQKELVASIGAYSLIAFGGSFRGSEVFLTDLQGLCKYLGELNGDHVIIPLLGRFKGELHSRYHLSPLAAETSSGLKIGLWIERLVDVREKEGRIQGPAFCDKAGRIAKAQDNEKAIMERLQTVHNLVPGLIPGDIEVTEHFGISRSFRRGATSTARTRGVGDKHIQLINRWRKFENA